MPLKIHLAANQRVLINGALVAVERQVRLVLLNQASIIRMPDQAAGAEQQAAEKLIRALFAFWLSEERNGARLIEELDQQRRDAAARGQRAAVEALDHAVQMIAQGADRSAILSLAESLVMARDP